MKRGNRAAISEKDSIYCSFYQKTGACMHGETCSRMHLKPSFSRTLLLNNFYQNPLRFIDLLPPGILSFNPADIQANFDEFYIDIYEELRTYGPIEDIVIASNLCDHLVGNVLVIYESIEDAVNALTNLRGRYYAGRPIDAQFSPVTSLDTAICRQFKEGNCPHDTKCNFIHPLYPSPQVAAECPLTKYDNTNQYQQEREHDDYRNDRSYPNYSQWNETESNRDSYDRSDRYDRDRNMRNDSYDRNDRRNRDQRNERDYQHRNYHDQRQYGRERRPDYYDERYDSHRGQHRGRP